MKGCINSRDRLTGLVLKVFGRAQLQPCRKRLGKEDGVSLNQWIAVAVAEKVGVVETAAAFFKKRAGNAKGDRLLKFLRQAPNMAPEPEDRIT
jgi:hypothetical protein